MRRKTTLHSLSSISEIATQLQQLHTEKGKRVVTVCVLSPFAPKKRESTKKTYLVVIESRRASFIVTVTQTGQLSVTEIVQAGFTEMSR